MRSTVFLDKLSATLREGGVPGVIKHGRDSFIYRYHLRRNQIFDECHGIETEEAVPLADLDIDPSRKADVGWYEATPISIVRQLIEELPRDCRDAAFIDLGCGKGRVLIAAAEAGFSDLLGVDLSSNLVSIARGNLETALAGVPDVSWAVEHKDASSFSVPQRNLVIFMYNPFGAAVLESVLTWMSGHASKGFSIDVIYYNSQQRHVLDSADHFELQSFSLSTRLKLLALSWHEAAWYRAKAATRSAVKAT